MKAMNPKVRMNPPRDIKGMECPDMYLLSSLRNLSTLGPRMTAPIESGKISHYLFYFNLNILLNVFRQFGMNRYWLPISA